MKIEEADPRMRATVELAKSLKAKLMFARGEILFLAVLSLALALFLGIWFGWGDLFIDVLGIWNIVMFGRNMSTFFGDADKIARVNQAIAEIKEEKTHYTVGELVDFVATEPEPTTPSES